MTPTLLGPGTGICPLAPGTPSQPSAWLGAACARRRGAVASSHHQPSMGPRPHPRRDRAKEGPFDSTRQAGERGLLFQCSAVCADRAPYALRWGLFFLAGNVLSPSGLGRSGGAPTGDRSSLWALHPVPSRGSSKPICCTAVGKRERWETCPKLISWLYHAGATSALLPTRGVVPGRPWGWQLAVRGLGCMLRVIPLCSAMGPVVVPEVHPYPSLC